jgi:hypothetical protein
MSLFEFFNSWNELPNTDKQITGLEAKSSDFPEPGETVLVTVQNVYGGEELGERRVVTSSLVPAPIGSTYRWAQVNNIARVLAWKPTPSAYES